MNSKIENPMAKYGDKPSADAKNDTDSPPLNGSGGGREPPPRYESNLHDDRGDDFDSTENEDPEVKQIRFLQTVKRQTNFIFLFGAAQRGKTVITSSIVNFLSSIDAKGELAPFKLTHDATVDEGRALLTKMRRLHANQRFPERTLLVGNNEPIYVNVKFTPNRELDSDTLSMTFLEMPGDLLGKVDSPTGVGSLPASINAFMRVDGLKPAFILITSPETAFDDDQTIVSFIEYITELDPRFNTSRFLLLVTKWDMYQGKLPIADFVAQTMPGTNAKLYNPQHSIAAFSIGAVDTVGGKPFLRQFNPEYPKQVVNWLYQEFTGKPLYRRSILRKILDGFIRFG